MVRPLKRGLRAHIAEVGRLSEDGGTSIQCNQGLLIPRQEAGKEGVEEVTTNSRFDVVSSPR